MSNGKAVEKVNPGRLDGDPLLDVKVIWRQVPKTIGMGHFGGRLAFAPDGKLFITSGERQRFDPAEDLTSNLGKVVRINPDGSIPGDNPLVNKQGARSDIWSYGHRNHLARRSIPHRNGCGSTRWDQRTAMKSIFRSAARTTAGRS